MHRERSFCFLPTMLVYLIFLFFICFYQWPYEAAALAFEAIPRTLAQNCGLNVIRTMTQLQGKVIIPNLV